MNTLNQLKTLKTLTNEDLIDHQIQKPTTNSELNLAPSISLQELIQTNLKQ